jgi:hypothetical protein
MLRWQTQCSEIFVCRSLVPGGPRSVVFGASLPRITALACPRQPNAQGFTQRQIRCLAHSASPWHQQASVRKFSYSRQSLWS